MAATDLAKNFVAGGVGGSFTVLVGHPFDTIKVRLQTMPVPAPGTQPLYTGTLDCVKKTLSKEGFFALYRGMCAPLVGVTPLFATFFAGCELGRFLQRKTSDKNDFTFIQHFNSGAIAGVLTTTFMTPGERIKCILQVQAQNENPNSVKYNGPVDVVKKLYKEGGIRSIYRGTFATLLRDVPASGTYMGVYFYLKEKLGGSSGELTPSATLIAGGFAGMANWAVCIPADVLKSRLQTAPQNKYPDGIRGVLREILKTEGVSALFRGFTPIMLRAFPANAACFMGMEMTLYLFKILL